MASRLIGDNPLSEPVMVYCQCDSTEYISMIFFGIKMFHSRKCFCKCRLWKWRPCCLGLNVFKRHFAGIDWGDHTIAKVTIEQHKIHESRHRTSALRTRKQNKTKQNAAHFFASLALCDGSPPLTGALTQKAINAELWYWFWFTLNKLLYK